MNRLFAVLAYFVAFVTFCSSLLAAEPETLFDGKTLLGWKGDERFWSVKDGVITGQTTKEKPIEYNTFLIWEGGPLYDFKLKLKFRIQSGSSGVQYRSKDQGNFAVEGYQATLETGDRYTGILFEEQGRGTLAERTHRVEIHNNGKKHVVGSTGDDKTILASIKKEDWNTLEISAIGPHLIHKINGHTTVDVTDSQRGRARSNGIIALQLQAGDPMLVQFKDIELTDLNK